MNLSLFVFLVLLCSASALSYIDPAVEDLAKNMLDDATDGHNDVLNQLYGSSISVMSYTTYVTTTNSIKTFHYKISAMAELDSPEYACVQLKKASNVLSVPSASLYKTSDEALYKCGV